ncbi:MAG: hypothetical protein JNM70_11950 [Anaerolineae bacterium]|nr:hypothetical protein [Anaerolineae bacterium]
MPEIVSIAWDRLKIIAAIVGDIEARVIVTVFYFTILVPFGLLSRLGKDPLRLAPTPEASHWVERHPVSGDLESAQRQG